MDIEGDVRNFVIDNFMLGANDGALGAEDSFLEKGIIDSTGVLEIIHFLETRFEISVDDEEMIPENLDSIRNIVQFIQRKSALVVGK